MRLELIRALGLFLTRSLVNVSIRTSRGVYLDLSESLGLPLHRALESVTRRADLEGCTSS